MSRTLSRFQAAVLGAIVVAGLALAGVGLFTVGSRQWLWSDTFHVVVGFPQIRGVEAGTRVRVQGIEAGEVETVEPPATPGGDVMLRLRLGGRLRYLLRADASAQIASEGMIGGRVIEINPGSSAALPIEENARLASRSPSDLTDVLAQVQAALQDLRDGQGTVGKFLKDPEAYANVVALLQQSRETMSSFQQDADALKRLPVVRSYVEDPQALLVRPDCARNRHCFAEAELFEPGRAVLTPDGRQRLDELAPWLAGLKQSGSEVVVVAYTDPKSTSFSLARTLTRQQSEAVCAYLKGHHAVQKMGWFRSRKVTAVGLGTSPPPIPDTEALPPSRVEILVFVPQA
jgi:phospholipid/cholesterol/gamma-HCH transport system substrate-binding protein